jgi:hypothetical protein
VPWRRYLWFFSIVIVIVKVVVFVFVVLVNFQKRGVGLTVCPGGMKKGKIRILTSPDER